MMIDQPATETVIAAQPTSETVKRMLTRKCGATLPELAAAQTGSLIARALTSRD